MAVRIALVASAATDPADAARLARDLAVPLLPREDVEQGVAFDALLQLDGRDLSLREPGPRAPGPVRVDFGDPAMRHRRKGGQNELLGRAIGVGRKPDLMVLDATAGLGRDSFVLADLGCRVRMCEREPVMAALLASGLERARGGSDEWLSAVAARIDLQAGDARDLPPVACRGIDVIYLDPMFPPRGKSAAVKKEMALFQKLLERGEMWRDEEESDRLLAWALEQPVTRVVAKRPLKARCLDDRKPSHQVRGKAVRFDVYTLRAWSEGGEAV